MIHIIVGLVAAALGVGAAAAVVTFWNVVRERILDWLRAHDLDKSVLTSAVVHLDTLVTGIRRRIVVQTPQRVAVVSEEQISLDQIDDPQLRARVAAEPQVRVDMLGQL